MSAIKYCIGCGNQLHEPELFAYCGNKECERFGLATVIYSTQPIKRKVKS